MKLSCLTLVVVFLSACSGKMYSLEQNVQIEESKLHQLYIDQDGNLLTPDSREALNPVEERNYVNNILAEYSTLKESNPNLVLTVFIHGGLNTFKAATSRVETFKEDMLADGKYPLFISWNSAPLTNYKDHLFKIRRGISRPVLGVLSSPFVLLEDGFRAIARVPASTYNVLFGQNTIRKSNSGGEKTPTNNALSQLNGSAFNLNYEENEEGKWIEWATVWNPIKLATAPILDGLGTGAWNSMLRRTDLVLRKDSGFSGDEKSQSHTAVTRFFTLFEKMDNDNQIDLIGHSMGAIIANNIVAKYPRLNFKNIVYMGAACRIKDLEYVIAPYLNHNQEARFFNLSIHTFRELSENSFYDFVPRGSLLIWIDQTFGATNSFVDRTAGYWPNIVRAASNVFKTREIRSRVYLTEFARNGDVPKKHGAFDEFNFWQENFWRGNRIDRYFIE